MSDSNNNNKISDPAELFPLEVGIVESLEKVIKDINALSTIEQEYQDYKPVQNLLDCEGELKSILNKIKENLKVKIK